jgi:hypothetical protein
MNFAGPFIRQLAKAKEAKDERKNFTGNGQPDLLNQV